jgi:DNA mismatch repair ATPase MutS
MKGIICMNQRRAKRQKAIQNQVNRLNNRLTKLHALSRRLSWYRLVIFLIGGALVFISFFWISENLAWFFTGISFISFSIIAFYHHRLEKGIRRHQIWLEIKKSQLARMDLDWENITGSMLPYPLSDLSFEKDLDITGRRSIHELIDISISREGSQRLATWLLQKVPDIAGILRRQRVVQELVPLSRFRNRLQLNFRLVSKAQLEGNKLLNWLQTEPPSRSMKNLAAISYGFAAVNITLFLWHQFGNISPYWMLSLFIYVLFYLSNLKLLKHFFFAFLIHRYRDEIAQQLPQWLTAWENLEASISLANFAYLNPDYVFPEFISDLENKDQPILTAKGLGHPLIPADQIVCNDFSLNKSGEAFIITGSNMSGKSSFLKTIGVNLCLAYAGGPVNAGSFQSALFRIFTCIKINDSIVDGFSFFYTEVKRLKALLDALRANHSLPLLFLIDEIFKGTNNRERLVGSRSYIRNLIGQNGAGLVATHDLELIKLADDFPSITNCHFREKVADGKMVFDYKLRPGPCPTTNALKIMRMEGLPVD